MRHKYLFLASFLVGMIVYACIWVYTQNSSEIECISAGEDKYVIVIDAGHGGFDGGAVASDGTVEKDINLQIARNLYDVVSQYPVEVYMTRTEDKSLDDGNGSIRSRKRNDLLERKAYIEEVESDLTISIHLNSYPADASICGAQVFYPKREQKRTTEQMGEQPSKAIAENVQKSLEINVPDGKERSALAKDDVLLLKDPSSPIILVECGFLSNPDECNRLKSLEYQGLIAEAIWTGINSNMGLEKKQKIQVIHSTNK